MTFSTRFVSSVNEIQKAWIDLSSGAGAFLDYRFLAALEDTHCVGAETSWQPHHLVMEKHGAPVAVMPGYIKYDSMGEYVFDHSWANAYYQHGLSYYPKWISAVPFTPVSAPKLLSNQKLEQHIVDKCLSDARSALEQNGVSSMHLLFCRDEFNSLQNQPILIRQSVQFQWFNYQYKTFDDFLAALTSRKRKEMKKVYRQLEAQEIEIRHHKGGQITEQEMHFFVECYQRTYLKRSGHTGYLNPDFFMTLLNTMPEHLILVSAYKHDKPIGSALFFCDTTGLYGRYWGATEHVDSLHFVCCYLEGIRIAIEQNLPLFNPGTQGEHKILRGFEPIYCYSLHQLFNDEFHQAVDNFLKQEHPHIINYFNQARDVLPFNSHFSQQLKTMNAIPPSVAFKDNK